MAMITGLISSLGFALVVASIAALIAMLFVVLRCLWLDTFLRSGRSWRLNEILESLASVFESVPLLILLILLGQRGLREDFNPLIDHFQKALVLGLFMYPSIWRYVNNRLDLAAEDVYPRQMGLWGIPALKVGFFYVLWKHNLSGVISSFIWVLSSALTLDLSIGFLSEYGLGSSYINWYENSLGSVIGRMIGDNGQLGPQVIIMMIITIGCVILLYRVSNLLDPTPSPVFNKLRQQRSRSQDTLYEFSELKLRPVGTELSVDPSRPLKIKEGEFIWLNGPSGSGKSLFIKSLMELLRLGSADSDLMPVCPLVHYKNGMISDSTVIMPQEPDLYIFPYLSVEDYLNCIIGQRIQEVQSLISGSYQGENKANLISLLKTVERISRTQVRNLSAGEKRMVAFVVALVQSLDPRYNIVIFDEPDSSLDINGVQALKFYLGKINTKSVIYVTHNVMHSKDIYNELRHMGIWDIIPSADNRRQYIKAVENVAVRYQEIHARISASLETLKTGAQNYVVDRDSRLRLRITFPLHIKIGRGLDLGATYRGNKINSLDVFDDTGLIGIVGDNGIGKSSLLRAVVGLNYCAEASITMGARSRPEARQSIHAAVFEHKVCYVYDDIEKALPHNTPLRQIVNELSKIHRRGVSDTKYISRLSDEKLHMPLVKFSGGERQKIIFDLVCHLIRCRVLLLDEPFSRLDWGENLLEVCGWLREKALECPIVIISHNHDILQALIPDKVYNLHKEVL